MPKYSWSSGLSFFVVSLAAASSHAASDPAAVGACLDHWGKHPFAKADPRFRVVAGGTQVIGFGGDVADSEPTDHPALVLVKIGTSVLTKKTVQLLNPHGWYCLKGSVAVLGKVKITLACAAHLAASDNATTVLGSSDVKGGVTALGRVTVERVGCPRNSSDAESP